jgi:protein-disulfide isomerase
MHGMACLAAKAVLCAYKEKGEEAYWKYHDLVFENQKQISHSLLTRKLAPKIGMDIDAMEKCIVSSDIEARLAREVEIGMKVGISGTPAVYVNGRYLRGWIEPTILRAVIEAELKRSKEN